METDLEPPGVPSHDSGNRGERQVQEGPARGPRRGGLTVEDTESIKVTQSHQGSGGGREFQEEGGSNTAKSQV